jgi:hypothetical protein
MIFAILNSSTVDGANTVFYILSILALVGGAILVIKSRIPQQTIKNLQQVNESYVELNLTLTKRIDSLEQKSKDDTQSHLDNAKAISDLQGQIKVYKELPLKELADGMKQVVESNTEILKAVQASGVSANNNADIAQQDTAQVAKTLRNKV